MKSEMSKISVVVPIYNRQNTLDRCINSILDQTYRNLEIILVNDGSTDDSLAVCREYEKNDSRVVVVDKPNGGVSSARNAGMDVATGKYIAFVDSDDYIDSTMYEKLIKKAENTDSDFTVCRFYIFHEKEQCAEKKIQRGLESFVYDRNIKKFLFGWNDDDSAAATIWVVLFRRELIKDIKFDEELVNEEDSIFFLQALLKAKRCSVLDDYLYFYVYDDGDNSGKYLMKSNYISSRIKHASLFCRLYENPNVSDEVLCVLYQDYAKIVIASCIKEKQYIKVIKDSINENPFCAFSRRKCYRSFKKIVSKKEYPFKQGILYWLIYHKCYRIIRLYYRLTGKLKITSDD